jgi:hypothetical protein
VLKNYVSLMTNDVMGDSQDRAEAVRGALIEAALVAYEDAGLSGLCAEGRWEAAVAAMRSLDVTAWLRLEPSSRPASRLVSLP